MKPVSLGILGTATIAVEKVIPAFQKTTSAIITAIASRDLKRAEEAAHKFNIPRAYGNYADLLSDPGIEAVYIPLPNHLHVPWAIRALAAGKHVLCEKPIALNHEEAGTLLKQSQDYAHLKIMEAFMYRFHPQWQQVKNLTVSGAIGEIKTIDSFFSFYDDDPGSISNQKELGGGSLMDIGCYCISLARFIFGREPLRVQGLIEYDPHMGIDRLSSGVMDFGDGISTFTCGMQLSEFQMVEILGTNGQIRLDTPFITPVDTQTTITLTDQSGSQKIKFGPCDQYMFQAEAFIKAIRTGTSVPIPLVDAVANMAVLDAVLRSGSHGDWEKI